MELRWDVTPRWSLLGFTGIGKAYGRWHDYSSRRAAPGAEALQLRKSLIHCALKS
ncbi:hypothetical protein FHX60_002956 [Cupriavidus alkaliphilus]|nr:hypothetical protein [Cupriavidus alkaliphilus]